MLRVSVIDSGPGIPEALQEKLFVPFERLGRQSGEIKGTGMGLTVTRELMEMMGGRIGFTSTEGEGCTFWVDFPLAEGVEFDEKGASARYEPADGSPRGAAQGSDEKVVLYIEDDPTNMQVMEMVLRDIPGITLLSADTAELGLSIAKEELPDLILMDINLPGMGGIEAVRHLKENETTRDIPVVAVTAAAMPAEMKEGKKAGFFDYLVKPFRIGDLVEIMENTLGRSG